MAGRDMVRVNGVEVCVETFGGEGDPAVLLIGGAAAAMDWWDPRLCERLAAGLRRVVRYDSRDTGQSTSCPAGAARYTVDDLVADAVGVFDVLGVARGHVVGISMGGTVALKLAVGHPDRVATLTVMSTSPEGPGGPARPDLPPMAPHLAQWFAVPPPPPDWSDRAAVMAHIVAGQRALAGPHGVDEARLREVAEQVVDRTVDIEASQTNHWQIDGGVAVRDRLGHIGAPTLVVHGTSDPLFPYGHAEALAREIPGAALLPLPDVGHEMPPPRVWDTLVPALLRHTSGGWEQHGSRLATRSLSAGSPTGWFDHLYAAARSGEVPMPWDRTEPHPLLTEWATARTDHLDQLARTGQRAVVVGCGLGADAEYLARLGIDTTAFDVSDTAVHTARERHPGSTVHYQTADLLDLPLDWLHAFDLVVEIITVQALPDPPRHQAIVNVGTLVASGGTLLVIAAAQDTEPPPDAPPADPPPWPLNRAEIDAFATDGLHLLHLQRLTGPRWRAEFHRPG